MSANFDFRAFRDLVAYPAKLIFSDVSLKTDRPLLVLRWWRGKDGKLDSRWERKE